MSDLNALLHWAIENTPMAQSGEQVPQQQNAGGMQLTFKPAAPGQEASKTAAALHPSDSQYPVADLSPASTPGPATPKDERPAPPSTEILDLIMGKPDSLTMKEKMAIATNKAADAEERVDALDDFEMLIELIDNANNMAVLKLWQPLLSLYDDEVAGVVRHALWITGTAVQNNLKAQAALFINGAFAKILEKIYPASGSLPSPTRAKGVYALSSALKHWPLASEALSADNAHGYKVLAQGVADSDLLIRRKMAFLLGTLVMQARDKMTGDEMPSEVRNLLEERAKAAGAVEEDLLVGLERNGVFAAAISALVKGGEGDVEYEENAVRALARAAQAGVLSAEEKSQLAGVLKGWGQTGMTERGIEGADAQEVHGAFGL